MSDAPESRNERIAETAANAAADCRQALLQGQDLIEALASEHYSGADDPSTSASPGAHARHLLDSLDCLLGGLDSRVIDYTARKRRVDIEHDQTAVQSEIARCLEALEPVARRSASLELRVRTEANQEWTLSTLGRELQFVTAHIVHHYALIRLTLAQSGIEAPPEFGVAPSTLAYREPCEPDGD